MSSVGKPDGIDGYGRGPSPHGTTDTPEFRRLPEDGFPAAAAHPAGNLPSPTDERAGHWRGHRDTAAMAGQDTKTPFGQEGGMTRRRWLQLMGASMALAGAGGCRWQKAEILPFADRPPQRTPGKSQAFATAMDRAGSAIGLLVTCVDGRPIKIEGNPKHPASLGATDAIAQASILELYDPDRSKDVLEKTGDRETVRTWEEFTRFVRSRFAQLRKTGGAGLRVLSEASSSPTLAAARRRLLKEFPEAKWHEYEPISRDNEHAGTRLAFGKPARPHYHLDRAKVILSLDADLLGSHPAAVRYARDFSRGREPLDGPMNRLYVVESGLSITGAAADHRLPIPTADVAGFLAALEEELLARVARPEVSATDPGARGFDSQPGQLARLKFRHAVVEDLVAHPGACLLAAGRGQPAEVHAAAIRLGARLGNVGTTVSYLPEPEPDRPPHGEAIRALVDDVDAGNVGTLLLLGGNPVYNAPAGIAWGEVLSAVETSIHLSLYRNETSHACTWHVPQAHFLESWGDARAYDGTYSVVQPLIEPCHGGKSAIELLAVILDHPPKKPEAWIRETFEAISGRPGGGRELEARWRRTVHDGLLAGSAWKPVSLPPQTEGNVPANGKVPANAVGASGGRGQVEVVFCQDAKVYDGRLANNGWLQEMPDPISRLTWGNAAIFSPATAEKLGVEDQTLVKLISPSEGSELEIPAYVMPGQADGSVAVPLGYGRTAAGHVGGLTEEGIEPVGTNAYHLRTSETMHFGTGFWAEPTGNKCRLASVQDHFAIDTAGQEGRARRVDKLIREATLEHYRKHPDFAKQAVHHPPLESLWEEPAYEGYRWGMTIDLSKCVGCGACVVACQAENNVPIVGKPRVLEGREMHWLRVDRFFKGSPQGPQVVVQPVPCQHCELAPCEQVCPVGATVHDQEGLNAMVYNRCVGTRYCANNCPYKVRRFNFFNYHQDLAGPSGETAKMAYNPEVTVRSRGVMEKCTYCVQRIVAAKIEAKNNRRRIADGELKTACQQACPTRAIVFGDLSDQDSAVARSAASDRSYAMLAELNVKPRTRYLARIRNPNPQLEGATD